MKSRERILHRLKESSPPEYRSKNIIELSQPVGGDIELFIEKATAAGAMVERVNDTAGVKKRLKQIIKHSNYRSIISSGEQVIGQINLPELADEMGIEYHETRDLDTGAYRKYVFTAELGITGCNYAAADTGTVIIQHKPGSERLISLVPDHYVCIVENSRILSDCYAVFSAIEEKRETYPALSLITGISRTADVALQVVTGMHGPRKVDIIIIG